MTMVLWFLLDVNSPLRLTMRVSPHCNVKCRCSRSTHHVPMLQCLLMPRHRAPYQSNASYLSPHVPTITLFPFIVARGNSPQQQIEITVEAGATDRGIFRANSSFKVRVSGVLLTYRHGGLYVRLYQGATLREINSEEEWFNPIPNVPRVWVLLQYCKWTMMLLSKRVQRGNVEHSA